MRTGVPSNAADSMDRGTPQMNKSSAMSPVLKSGQSVVAVDMLDVVLSVQANGVSLQHTEDNDHNIIFCVLLRTSWVV
jgi:hypothetical protein